MSKPKRRRPRIGLTAWKRPVHTMVGGPEQLFTLAEEYVECVRQSGGIPLILPPAPLNAAADAVASVDALVLTGGGDFSPSTYSGRDEGVSTDIDLQEDAWDVALTLAAKEARLPFFGICRGMQALNIALGGTLYQDISDRANHPPVPGVPADAVAFRHPVKIKAESRLGGILGVTERSVNSIHHQAVDRLGEGLVPVAHAPDGIIEGVEYNGASAGSGWPCLAVQWHPERMGNGLDQRIFDEVVRMAAERSRNGGG